MHIFTRMGATWADETYLSPKDIYIRVKERLSKRIWLEGLVLTASFDDSTSSICCCVISCNRLQQFESRAKSIRIRCSLRRQQISQEFFNTVVWFFTCRRQTDLCFSFARSNIWTTQSFKHNSPAFGQMLRTRIFSSRDAPKKYSSRLSLRAYE